MARKIVRKPAKAASTPQKTQGLKLRQAFGARVCELRKAHGWSQEKFADNCGMHRAHMGQVERGKVDPALTTIAKLVRTLGMTPGEILDVVFEQQFGALASRAAPE